MTSARGIDYSVVVPVYNSQGTLEELVERLKTVFAKHPIDQYEIVLVDDFSRDASWTVMQKIRHLNPSVKIIKLSKNFGQQSATLCGMGYVSGEIIITLDDDLQHRPEDIPKMLEALNGGLDVVMARYDIKQHGIIRNIITKINTSVMFYVFDTPKDLGISSFRMFRKNTVENILRMKSSYPHIPAFIFKTTPMNKIGNVTVRHDKRKIGKSGYNLIKLLQMWSNLIINYSAIPLIICGFFGIMISIFSFGYALWILFHKLLNPEYGVMGWNSLIVAITFLGGAILIALSIIGEYLRRILAEVSYGKPFIIETMEL